MQKLKTHMHSHKQVEAVVTTTPLAPFSKLIGEGIEKMVKELQDQQEVLQFKNHRSENS